MAERRIQNAGSTWAGGSIRASDAEREQVIQQLQQHYVDGRITDEELTERVDHLLKSRTRGALVEVTRDLPPLTPPTPPALQTTGRRHYHHRHTHRRGMPLAALLVAVLGVMLFVLPGLVIYGFGGPVGPWPGPPFPPLLGIFMLWLVLRLATRSRWR